MDYTEQTPLKIQSLSELITALTEEERATYSTILHHLHIPLVDFTEFCSWSEDSYTRNCIAENEEFELILLCWNAGQKTPIHDHGGEECWVKVLDGEFRETIYKEDETGTLSEASSAIAKTGEITYMKDFMGYHSLENLSKKKSMSLHLYAKPIRNCNIFCEESKEITNKNLVYDTVAQ